MPGPALNLNPPIPSLPFSLSPYPSSPPHPTSLKTQNSILSKPHHISFRSISSLPRSPPLSFLNLKLHRPLPPPPRPLKQHSPPKQTPTNPHSANQHARPASAETTQQRLDEHDTADGKEAADQVRGCGAGGEGFGEEVDKDDLETSRVL